jgi:phosphoribosylformimino-5-aminoimidazole carboxamide ribonucleotide (ProFAR) isomerase
MQGTDLEWFRSLRAATRHAITAAGGITTFEDVRALTEMQIDCAIGMSIYTGRLSLHELREFNAAQMRG